MPPMRSVALVFVSPAPSLVASSHRPCLRRSASTRATADRLLCRSPARAWRHQLMARRSLFRSPQLGSPYFMGDSRLVRRSRKPVWAVSSIEGSNPSLSAQTSQNLWPSRAFLRRTDSCWRAGVRCDGLLAAFPSARDGFGETGTFVMLRTSGNGWPVSLRALPCRRAKDVSPRASTHCPTFRHKRISKTPSSPVVPCTNRRGLGACPPCRPCKHLGDDSRKGSAVREADLRDGVAASVLLLSEYGTRAYCARLANDGPSEAVSQGQTWLYL
jgi:hypothetical protein